MKKMNIVTAGVLLCFFLGHSLPSAAQDDLEYPTDFKGVILQTKDKNTEIEFNFRMQSQVAVSSLHTHDLSPAQLLFQIPRMRFKTEGYLLDPRLTFEAQVALGKFGNLLYDAYLQYAITPYLGIRFGQYKAPGNREQLISSGDLSLVDRSILNSAYSLERDIGLMLLFEENLGSAVVRYDVMLSNGEGRNILTDQEISEENELDVALIQRIEFLPFGAFEGDGAYFKADLLREETPKLAIGGGYSHNNDAIQTNGQWGDLLLESRNINTTFVDMMFKYQGWSLMAEYMKTDSGNPVTYAEEATSAASPSAVAIGAGDGYMVQGGYVWPSMWGLSARYSETTPHEDVLDFYSAGTETRLGVSKYIRGHRIKVQSDVGYLTDKGLSEGMEDFWEWRLQVELGF